MTRIPTSADNASVDTAQSPDPQSPASFPLCLIDVGRIRPYEHNPRHGDHPEYDRIKDSIRQAGLDQPLVITQRPGAGDYIVHSGGNTRLSILKALWHETGERRFADIPCRVIPWNGETDVLLAHLRENDLRGHLTFIDKARAVCAVKRLLAAQRDEDLSQRQLEAALRQAGYGMTQARISQMIYAVNRLLPLIPFALEQGLGRPQVERIRALERAAKAVWQQGAVGSNEEFTEVFEALCRRYDAPDWETDLLHGALASEIAVTLEVGIQTARTMLDVQLAGREWIPLPLEPTPPEEGPSPGDATLATTEGPESQIPSTSPPAIPPAPTPGSKPRAVDPPRDDASGPRIPPHHGSPERSGREGSAPTGSAGSGPPGVCRDLPSLRRQAAALALGLAQRHAMGELVIRVPEAGIGVFVAGRARIGSIQRPPSEPRPSATSLVEPTGGVLRFDPGLRRRS